MDFKQFRARPIETRLERIKTSAPMSYKKNDAQTRLSILSERLGVLQHGLYIENTRGVLVILQGMDTSGKDGIVRHVFSGVNPTGCIVTSFKAPTEQELEHDYLWRHTLALPPRGSIGIFNRSYYEEVGVVRVHPELLENQHLHPSLTENKDGLWSARYGDINNFEKYLTRNGTSVIKLYLHISREEQKKRLLDRLQEAEKGWKFNLRDVEERHYWRTYQDIYSEALSSTSTDLAPWYVIPADQKWYARLVIAKIMVAHLESLNIKLPEISSAKRKEMQRAKKLLAKEK